VIKGVKNPQTVAQRILVLIEETRRVQNSETAINTVDGLKKFLGDVKKELGEDGFKKVISGLDEKVPSKPTDEDLKNFWRNQGE
jgi:hypothetical protein